VEFYLYAMKNTLCFLLFLIVGCQSGQEKVVAPLSDEQLVRILADLAVADAAVTSMSGQVRDSLAQVLYLQIFTRHATTVEVYEQALRVIANDETHLEKLLKQAEALVTTDTLKAGTSPSTSK
jgi:Domain of unknown function (DUF4296)